MIKIKNKGLYSFAKSGNTKGIMPAHRGRLKKILRVFSQSQADLRKLACLPGFHKFGVAPEGKTIYAVRVSGSWRVTFQIGSEGIHSVDYLQYH